MAINLLNLLPDFLVTLILAAVYSAATRWIWLLCVVVFSYFSVKVGYGIVWHSIVIGVVALVAVIFLMHHSYYPLLNIIGVMLYAFFLYGLFRRQQSLNRNSPPSDHIRSEDELLEK